jgi:DNA-directed RNA polymerase subunit RPC12/RpoP
MFTCERCGSSYSSMHAVGIENCPRCLLKDRTAAPLSLKVFNLPDSQTAANGEQSEVERQPEPQEDAVSA